MMTVKEVSRQTGVSIRTLQYYDNIGLLKASAYTEAGYRLYDETALKRLQQILLFRELEFPLKEIQRILGSPDFDGEKAIAQQIELLTMKKERLEGLISLARGIQQIGGNYMDFSAFDSQRLDEYTEQAKQAWGHTVAYKEFEEKRTGRSKAAESALGKGLMAIFAELGQVKTDAPESEAVQALVVKLQGYICENYYSCTKPILLNLGQMYAASGEFTENIDAVGGAGTAEFTNRAIQIYCK